MRSRIALGALVAVVVATPGCGDEQRIPTSPRAQDAAAEGALICADNVILSFSAEGLPEDLSKDWVEKQKYATVDNPEVHKPCPELNEVPAWDITSVGEHSYTIEATSATGTTFTFTNLPLDDGFEATCYGESPGCSEDGRWVRLDPRYSHMQMVEPDQQ